MGGGWSKKDARRVPGVCPARQYSPHVLQKDPGKNHETIVVGNLDDAAKVERMAHWHHMKSSESAVLWQPLFPFS